MASMKRFYTRQIRQCGFIPCRYDPFARRLSQVENETLGNIIYVRDHSRHQCGFARRAGI